MVFSRTLGGWKVQNVPTCFCVESSSISLWENGIMWATGIMKNSVLSLNNVHLYLHFSPGHFKRLRLLAILHFSPTASGWLTLLHRYSKYRRYWWVASVFIFPCFVSMYQITPKKWCDMIEYFCILWKRTMCLS